MNGQGSDPLEEKYLNLYEQKLSPFQLVRIIIVILVVVTVVAFVVQVLVGTVILSLQ